MPIPIHGAADAADTAAPEPLVTAVPTPFPARTRQQCAMVNGTRTDVAVTQFADKIMITISQQGRLGHWIHVPLQAADAGLVGRRPRGSQVIDYDDEDSTVMEGSDLLPLPHLTATTIFGGGASDRDTFGQLLATQIGSALSARNPNESRLLVLGMGLVKSDIDVQRETFHTLVGLVVSCLGRS